MMPEREAAPMNAVNDAAHLDPDMNATHDPLLPLIEGYRAGMAACDALPDDISDEGLNAVAAATWLPFYEATAYPIPTTARGAAEALRVALDENDAGEFVTAMICAALGYLDRQQG